MYFQVQVTSVTETRCSHRACMSISDHGTTTCSNLSPEGLRLSCTAGTELDLLRRKSPTHAANTSTPNDTTKTRRGKSTIARCQPFRAVSFNQSQCTNYRLPISAAMTVRTDSF